MNTVWKENALQVIQDIFRNQFFDDSLAITEHTTPADIEEWDSLAHVNLLASIENAFNIRFTADDMANIDSIAVLLATMVERGAC
ncbi:acyl carrier protein [Geomonas paludis]|uniref:Uncharacterized protein n=1 Tax=Geomonas paludis TaxID=2740185 RepID=A0A6V8MUT6_9BACT|nr:acyl carrier protein [Geomonas paludis]GFO63832.1 hypothetical protein GMPD_17510 [Geomonas paludis]